MAVGQAWLRGGRHFLVQAAAGGVGIKAVEYAQWLGAGTLGTAGRAHKHMQLRAMGVGGMCSSRDGTSFGAGAARLLRGKRLHGGLNSLSLDFIAASFALHGAGGCFNEIGKRAIWAQPRRAASAEGGRSSAQEASAAAAEEASARGASAEGV